MTNIDLTERLTELLRGCEVNNEIGKALFTVGPSSYSLSPFVADLIAQQLAPEIEKMMPRWIPVGERLPDEGLSVDLWHSNLGRVTDVSLSLRGEEKLVHVGKAFLPITKFTHWMPIPKGPMG